MFSNVRFGTKKRYSFWWHIDAAFGAFTGCIPTHQHLLQGWECADSITIDCHKWLNIPYDSGVILTRKEHQHLHTQVFTNGNAAYLDNAHSVFTYLNFLPENSRRFRALPAFVSLMAYGRLGFQSIVENNIHLAQEFGKRLTQSKYFELIAPVRLNVVCFTLKNQREKIPKFISLLNGRGQVFMTPTKLFDIPGLRAALVNWRTTEKDIDIAMRELEIAYKLL